MSVYKHTRSPYFLFDFQLEGHRFHGSTKCTTKREAEAVERAEREKAREYVKQAAAARTSMRLDDIAGRYWSEVGQHHVGAKHTAYCLSLLIGFFGKDKLLTEVTGDDVTKLVAWRRGHLKPNHGSTLISPHTVNHTTLALRKLFTRAKLWGVRFQNEPQWVEYMLDVPDERVREVSEDESERIEVAAGDYLPLIMFARASGLRLTECLLRWSEVDFGTRQIRKLGKRGLQVGCPITSEIREILWPLRGHHPEFVFTYVEATSKLRRPLTYAGVQSFWRRLRKATGVTGLRFHDLRHDFGTKLLRATGNLKLVQKAMNHRNISTTLRYAHVLDAEVADGMERAALSRTKSRNRLKVV
jgi:integrase